MTFITEKRIEEREVVVGFTCSCCKKIFKGTMHTQEAILIEDVGGYYCAFGDCVNYQIHLCTDCAYSILKDYVEYPEEDI